MKPVMEGAAMGGGGTHNHNPGLDAANHGPAPLHVPLDNPALLYAMYVQQLQLVEVRPFHSLRFLPSSSRSSVLQAYPWLAHQAAPGLLSISTALSNHGAVFNSSPAQQPFQSPGPVPVPVPTSVPSDAALLMEAVLKASSAKAAAAAASPPLLLPSPSAAPVPASAAGSLAALTEEESIAVSVLASFAHQKTAQVPA